MALLIIICGTLLMLGGAASLFFGFEIVVTERGSAMVISGTVALAGGLVAVGIGFALLRLSQLLGTLEPRTTRPTRPLDRPVVPLGGARPSEADIPRKDMEPESARRLPEAATLTRPSDEGVAPRSFGTMAAVGGLATAAALGTGLVGAKAESRDHPDDADSHAPLSKDASLEPRDASSESTEDSEAEPAPMPEPPLMTPDDLEAELAQALAETDPSLPATPEQEPEHDQILEPEPEQVLPRFLSKSTTHKARKGAANQTMATDDLSAADEAAISEQATSTRHAPSEDMENVSEQSLDALDADEQGMHADETKPILEDIPDTLADQTEEKTADAYNAESVITHDHASEAGPKHKSQVLGTYNSGGRTYTMYADGTVEAMTENGIQHFASMEELRLHLSRV